MENYSGAYIIEHGGTNRSGAPSPRPRRGFIGILVAALLLSAAVCLLVLFLPRASSDSSASGFAGRTVYLLSTGEFDSRDDADTAAELNAARGGAGYVYNDGRYHVIAAAYASESDARTLASLNTGSSYFAVTIAACACSPSDRAALEYLTGEWFADMSGAAAELERGRLTDARAELSARSACRKLAALIAAADIPALRTELAPACAYLQPGSRSVRSYIRLVTVRTLDAVTRALA